MSFKSPVSSVGQTLRLINVNSANTDVGTLVGLPAKYRILRVFCYDATTSITTATIAIYTAAGAGGTALCSPQAISGLVDATTFVSLTLATGASTQIRTEATLYFRNVVAQGGAATISVEFQYIDCT